MGESLVNFYARINKIDAEEALNSALELRSYDENKVRNIWPSSQYYNIFDYNLFIGDYKDSTLITIRGTDSLVEWWRNFMWRLIPVARRNKIKIHKGFRLGEQLILGTILSELKKKKSKFLIICGHSLGGAIATLLAYDIKKLTEVVDIRVITFGSPKVGNAQFAQDYAETVPHTLRIVNDNDWVCKYPPLFIGKKYRHVGRLIQLGNLPKSGFWPFGKSNKFHDWKSYTDALLLYKDLTDNPCFKN